MLHAPLVLAAALASAPLNVAVLYFDNDTGKAEYDVLRKGLADMLATDLAQVPPLQIVEREKLEAVMQEQKLQRTKAFDPKTAVKLGKLVGASHAVAGALNAVAPRVRLDIRLFEVATAKVLVTGTVTGKPEDLFDLEEELVRRFAQALDARLASGELASGRTGLDGLLRYSQALDLVDRGDLAAAQSKLGEVVRASPEFQRAKVVYAETIKRVREAERRRGAAQADVEGALERSLEAWRGKRLADQRTEEELQRFFAYRALAANLAVFRIRRLLGVSEENEVAFVPPSKRAELERYEAAFVEAGERLAADLREYRARGNPLSLRLELAEEDERRAQELSGVNLGEWSFATPTSVAGAVAEYLALGDTPHWSDVKEFRVRPVAAARTPALQKKADALFDAALRDLPVDYPPEDRAPRAYELLLPRGDGLVLRGKKEEAIAQWQLFLDGYPKAEKFEFVRTRMETLLGVAEQLEQDRKWVRECGAPDTERASRHAWRILRAEGGAGLLKLAAEMARCAKKQAGWTPLAFGAAARASLDEGDCPAYRALRDEARRQAWPVTEPRHACDAP